MRAEVEHHLSAGHVRLRGAVGLYSKAPIAIGLIALSWAVLLFVRPDVVGVALCIAGLGFGGILVAFCVQHDANHGAYFKSRRYNHAVGWTADALLGFSSYAWRTKHNVAHHTYTNIDGYDNDIEPCRSRDSRRSSRHGPGTGFSTCTCGRSTRSWGSAGRRSATSELPARLVRQDGDQVPVRLGLGPAARRQGDLRRLGDRPPAARVSVVGSAGHVRRAHDGDERRDGDDVPARALRRGGELRRPEDWRPERASGRCTRSRRRSTSAPATSSSRGPSAASTTRSSTISSRGSRTRSTHDRADRQRTCLRHGVRYTVQPSLWVALRSHVRHLRELGRAGLRAEQEMG